MLLHIFKRLTGVDDPVTVSVSVSHIKICLPDTFKKFHLFLFKPVRGTAIPGTLQADRDRHVQQQGQIGTKIPLHQLFQGSNLSCVQAAPPPW